MAVQMSVPVSIPNVTTIELVTLEPYQPEPETIQAQEVAPAALATHVPVVAPAQGRGDARTTVGAAGAVLIVTMAVAVSEVVM